MQKRTIFSLLIVSINLTMNAQTITSDILEKVRSERISFESLGKIYPVNESVKVEAVQIAGVNCYWFTPQATVSDNIIVFLHGGGFALGNIHSHRALVSELAASTQFKILFVEYSLAPEHPYPSAITEIAAVCKALSETHKGRQFIFMGDSAGGTLAVSTTHFLMKQNDQLPAALILISPLLNLKCNTNSYKTRQTLDPILKKEYVKAFVDYYLQGAEDESADPNEIIFDHFPPLLALAGTNEILFDDSKIFHEYIKTIQPRAFFRAYPNQTHVWLITDIKSQESKETLMDINNFLGDFRGR
jgi:monoterpene epsilon-lactone hydrolase